MPKEVAILGAEEIYRPAAMERELSVTLYSPIVCLDRCSEIERREGETDRQTEKENDTHTRVK